MIYHGNALAVLTTLPANHYHCVVTSPPYWSLRDYGVPPTIWDSDQACPHVWESAGTREGYTSKKKWQHSVNGRGDGGLHFASNAPAMNGRGEPQSSARARRRKDHPIGWQPIEQGKFCATCGAWLGCLGLEPTPELYVAHIVAIFDQVRRVLRKDGTLWLNIGDCFAAGKPRDSAAGGMQFSQHQSFRRDRRPTGDIHHKAAPGIKPKDLVGIPWMVAFALRASGWYLRMDNIWAKTNPMPESITDRPTKSHEYVFLFSKSEAYFYDKEAVREPDSCRSAGNKVRKHRVDHGGNPSLGNAHQGFSVPGGGRNLRSVWTFSTAPYKGAHFATFPPRLPRLAILAGTSARGCCPQCAAPFKRVIDLGDELREQKVRGGCNADGEYHGQSVKAYAGTGAQTPGDVKRRILQGMRERLTVGWRPTCACGGFRVKTSHSRRLRRRWYRERWQARLEARWSTLFGGVKPCRVLDPFHGVGTTSLVAVKLGRDADGIELSAEYVALGADRAARAQEAPGVASAG